eukprot:CAMPEP_0113632276 /NCGR_PEP_ID=MMETSP0017_2-20120614/16773_1 /TAXON_ID=2856 /ORGANISM="Cylindrotheca closterium" /LENGTH=230 /DNA_ID=CAMNT_0000542819 /DNA_START=88 /DNA_END=780 /DNA_ORIENTATION=+ /assembly_acc=CAM_ASM_000147
MAGMTAKKATSVGALGALCCCLVCCAFPGVAALMILNSTIAQWPAVDGVVVSTRYCGQGGNNNDQGDPTYYITYNYTTVDGQAITAETDYCTNPVPDVGETKSITYDPDDPSSIVEEYVVDAGLIAAKTATGLGFGFSVLALCVAAFMCAQPDPPADPATYQQNNNTYQQNAYEQNTYSNAEYGNSSVPASGPAGDIPTPSATAVPMTPAVVYNGANEKTTSSGPVTYYK